MNENVDRLDTEIELMTASLLPSETLESSYAGIWPRVIDISSTDSKLALRLTINDGYPTNPSAVNVEVRGEIDREEAEIWKSWIGDRMSEWDEGEE